MKKMFKTLGPDVRPTGDQEVAGSIPARSGNILSWRLITKYFLRSISIFRPASILRKSTSGRHRPVSYLDGPMTARYRFT